MMNIMAKMYPRHNKCIGWKPSYHVRPITSIDVQKQFLMAVFLALQNISNTRASNNFCLKADLFGRYTLQIRCRIHQGVTCKFLSLHLDSTFTSIPSETTYWNIIVSLWRSTIRHLFPLNSSSGNRRPKSPCNSFVCPSQILRDKTPKRETPNDNCLVGIVILLPLRQFLCLSQSSRTYPAHHVVFLLLEKDT